MTTTLLILIGASMIVTNVINFAKPAYEQFVGRFNTTINIALSFGLGIAGAFAISPYLELELSTGALVLLGLALGTGATIFYDLLKLVQNAGSTKSTVSTGSTGSTKKDILIELPEEEDE